MSIEAHPNINAAGFTTEIIQGFLKHLRGKAAKHPDALEVLKEDLVEFVTQVSTRLDERFGR